MEQYLNNTSVLCDPTEIISNIFFPVIVTEPRVGSGSLNVMTSFGIL